MLKNKQNLEKKMKRFRNLLILSLAIAGFLMVGTAAKADPISLTITPDLTFQSGPGPVFEFYETVTNTGSDTVYLNGDDPVLGAGLSLDDSPFNTNPSFWVLAPGDFYTGLLFTVTAPSYVEGASNLYTGSFTILGGADNSAGDPLATVNFDIQVTPEPSSLVLLLTGMAGLAGTLRRRLIG
jgi:hypothetical protein